MKFAGLMGRATAAAAAIITTFVLSASSPAEPAGEVKAAAIQAGDVAVTGFSGTVLATDKLPPGVDPLDRTLIDPSGPSLRVFDVSALNGAPAGQLLNAPVRLDIPAKDIGQVFAMALDPGTDGAAPQLYAAATSAFGLNIVGADRAADGKPVRLKAGAPDANFMEGQFGALSSDSPGAIYKIDGGTGALTYIADTAFSGKLNSGVGIGGLAYDPATRTLYASDLDSGLIHRFGLDYNAADLGQFDHGVTGRAAKGLARVADDGKRLDITSSAFKADDPSTWGFTQPARRVDALAVRDGRLYYAVAEGPEIWSVGLNGGAFLEDARLEVAIKSDKPYPVTGIAFDSSGRMLVAQRGPVKNPYDYGSFADSGGQVLRYAPEAPDDPATPDLWKSDPATYAVGTADDSNAGSGGVSLQYGYKPDGTIDFNSCDATIAVTGDTLGTTASGVQLNSAELVRPANAPPKESAFIDYDAHQEDANVRGHVGAVTAVRQCGAAAGFPPVEAEGPPIEGAPGEGGAFPPVEEGGGGAFPTVEEGGGGTTTPDESQTFPEVVDEGGGETAEGGGLVITKSPGTGTCSEKGGCTFNIDVTNNSGKELPEIVVSDDLTAGAANLGGAKLDGAQPAGWTCTAPPKMTCKHAGPVADGETVSLPLSFTPTGLGQEPELKNCATAQSGGAPAPVVPQVAVPAPTAAEKNGIKVEQKPVATQCSATGGGCEWEIKITNTSAETKTGVLELTQGAIVPPKRSTVPAELEGLTFPPGMSCIKPAAANTITCFNKTATLAPGQSMTFTVKFKPTVPPNDPGFVQNAAVVKFNNEEIGVSLAGIPLQKPAAGDQAGGGAQPDAGPAGPVCATLPVEETDEDQAGGGGKTEAGPITIEKTHPGGPCAKDTPCSFDITVSNTSDNDIPGPITITETLSKPTAVPPAPWTCVQAAGAGFQCTHPGPVPANGTLQPSLSFAFVPPFGATQLENCASLGQPLPAGIPAPAKPACVTAPVTQPTGQGKPALSIKKTGPAECSDLGGHCDFKIQVTNDGDAPFTGPLDINEEVTADGKIVPGTLSIPGPNSLWKCTQAGSPFTCSLTNVTIGPKGTATLNVSFLLNKLTGAKTMENCANVVGQGAKACVSVPLIQGPKLVIEKKATDGVCDPLCTFQITATNVGNAKLPGPIKIIDFPSDIKSDSGDTDIKAEVVSVKTTDMLQDASCAKPGNILCTINRSLEPGQSVTIELTTKAGLTDFAGDNCAMPADRVVDDALKAKSCVAMLGLRHGGPNLVIDKEAPNAETNGGTGHCGLTTFCSFQITIKNIGDAPFTGVLHLTDTVGPGTPVRIFKSGGFGTCDEAQNSQGAGGFSVSLIKCDIGPFPEGIKPNDTVQLTVDVMAGVGWGSNKNLQNCAELSADTDMGPPETRKKDCADVKLDPFDVAVEKTGDQNCKPGGECRFDIDIFNPNPSVTHDDPVTVTDKLSGLSSAEIVSITKVSGDNAFPCKPAPTQIPFTCTGKMHIEPGEHNHYTMVVRLPADASAASFSNCASVGGNAAPVPRSEGGPGPAGQQSCHKVKVAPPEQQQPSSLRIDKTGPATCKPGSECAFDITLTNTGAKSHTGAVTLTDGLSGTASMSIVSIAPPLPCADQPAEIPFSCKTADDFTIPAGGKRTFKVTARVPRSAEDFTNCAILGGGKGAGAAPPSGERASGWSSCHSVKVEEPTTEEPRTCSGGMVLMDEGVCACPAGTSWNGRACTKPTTSDVGGGGVTTPTPCPRERPNGTYPNCCPSGTRFADGACRGTAGPPPPPVCTGRRPVGTYPNCCPRDMHFARGACRPDEPRGGTTEINPGSDEPCPRSAPVGSPPNCCPRNTHFERGACRRDVTPPPPVCEGRRPVGTFPNCCPRGTHFARGACRPDGGGPGNGGTDGNTGPTTTTKPPVCEGRRPVGTYPNCCPVRMHFERGACRRDGSGPGDGGTTTKPPVCEGRRPVGTYPNCCPRGTHFAGGSCRRDGGPGDGGTDGSTQPCPAGSIGKYPNCKCPLGWLGTPPRCCPPGTRYENGKCVRPKATGPGDGGGKPCPPGTRKTRSGQCVTDATPKPNTTNTGPGGKCTGGRHGVPPNCFCPRNSKFIGGRCRFMPKPKPTGPSPAQKCPQGMKGPKCDQVIVH